MDLGETMQTLKRLIYQYAKSELTKSGAPLSLQTIIVDAVAAEFKSEAYQESLFEKSIKKTECEEHTGTIDELKKAFEDTGVKKK